MSVVQLFRDEDWNSLPRELQERIEAGVERIRVLRDKIGAEAKVTYMPPITVVPAGWSRDGRQLIHGVAGAWRDDKAVGGFSIGVLLSAGPALCEDEATVRAVVVHEFAHCFQLATVVVNHNDLSTPLDALHGDSMDPEREKRLLANPADWFGPPDVELMQWGDERMRAVAGQVEELVVKGDLPGTQPPIVKPASFVVPNEWKAHIRNLRLRSAGQ